MSPAIGAYSAGRNMIYDLISSENKLLSAQFYGNIHLSTF